jgi:hypothetical protein
MKNDISFNFETMKWEGITVTQVQFWENAYPLVDVVAVLTKRMPAWLDANPSKAKKTQWKKFIVNWLSREQSKYEQFRR